MLAVALRFFDDPSSPGLHAYVALAGIPQGIVEELSRLAEGAVTVAGNSRCRQFPQRRPQTLLWIEYLAGKEEVRVEEKQHGGERMDVGDETEHPDEMACESGESSDEYMPDDESVPDTTTTPSLGETDAALPGYKSVVFLFIPLVVTIPSTSIPPCYIDCN
ncbi:hypothetical protein V3C99_000980 [Haemonchus contortus]